MSDEVTAKSLTYVEVDLDVYRVTVFENEPVAAGLPLNWAAPASTTHTVSLVASPTMPSGKALRIIKTTGNRSQLLWTPAAGIRDASAVGLFRTEVSGLTNMGVTLRASGSDGAESGYAMLFRSDVQVEIFKLVAGVSTSLAVGAFLHGEGENLWLRFDALNVTGGVLLRGKAWRGDVDDEPEDFGVSFTETTNILAAGGAGLVSTSTNTPDSLCGLFRARSLFSQLTETLRFTRSTDYAPANIDAVPSLLEVQVSPGMISLGENLGERSTVTAAFRDHRHADLGELFDRGTYWGKFRARQLFRRGQPIRMIRGFLGDALADMETRHYVLDSFDGPSLSGAFQFVGKDPLKLADNDRALAPRPSSGSLVADILAAATSLTLSPGGIGNAEYSESGYAAIGGKEIVAFVRGGNDAFTKVLLQFPGADTSTTFTDSNAGGGAHTWTAAGNAQIDTAISKFGGSAGLFDGTGDWITALDSADFALGSSDFTVDLWFNCNAAGGTQKFLCGQCDSTPSDASTSFRIGRLTSNVMHGYVAVGGTPFFVVGTTVFTNAINTGWHHLAFTRVGSVLRLFIDGVQEGGDVAIAGTINNSTNNLRVGAGGEFTTDSWNGSIDEFRLSVGVTRWPINFAPPVGAFVVPGDVMSILRGQFGTTAIDHKVQDRVQLCLLFNAQSPDVIIQTLLTTYAEVDPLVIPSVNWATEVDAYLDRLYTKMIADPEGVRDLVSRLIKQAGLAVWWDSAARQIKLQVLRGVSTDAFTYDQSNVLSGTIAVQEQPDKRKTQVWTYYGVRNPLEPLDQQNNFRSGLVTVDLEAELLNGGSVIDTVYADWIPAFGQTTAQRVNDLQIGRFVKPPRKVSLSVMRGSGVLEPELGGGYRLGNWAAQTEYGSAALIPFQVTRLTPMADQIRVEGEEMLFVGQSAADLQNRVILFDSDVNDVNLKSVHDSIFPVLTATDVTNLVTVTAIVGSGATVGASSRGTSAFTVGTGWPSGADITIRVQSGGRIAGAGGRGAFSGGAGANPGEQGGTALFTRTAVDLDVSAGGVVAGGGGGGGGGPFFGFFDGGAGGGGAGRVPGDGGLSNGGQGSPGTLLAGGAGELTGFGAGTGNGGAGGNPGQAGTAADVPGAVPGTAGTGIDGVSFVTTTLGTGSILGPQVN